MSCEGCTKQFIGCGGNLNSNVVFIGQSPGANDKPGQPFSGYVARDLDYYLLPRVAKLDRSEVLFTNVVQCKSQQDSMPAELGINCSRKHLPAQIRDAAVLVVMGTYACKVFGITDLEKHHGIPIMMDLPQYNWSGIVIPVVHPAMSSHDAYVLGELKDDFTVIKEVLNGTYVDVKPFPKPLTIEFNSNDLPTLFGCPIAIDTEDEPDLISFSYSFECGYVSHLNDPNVIPYLNNYFKSHQGPIVMHNKLWDMKKLRKFGIDIPDEKIIDTMILAYNQGYGSRASDDSNSTYGRGRQSLKYLAWRLLRFDMIEYADLAHPWYIKAQQQWAIDGLMLDWPDIQTNTGKVTRSGRPCKPTFKQHPMRTKLQHLLDIKSPYESYIKWPSEQLSLITKLHRKFPSESLELVPFSDVINYAGQDAVATWGIYNALRSRSRLRTVF